MDDNSEGGGGIYFIVGALVAAVVAMFVMLSGNHAFLGGGHDQMRIETPHAALAAIQPPLA